MKLILKNNNTYIDPNNVSWKTEGAYIMPEIFHSDVKLGVIKIVFKMYSADDNELYQGILKFDENSNKTPLINIDGVDEHLLTYLASNPMPENAIITSWGYAEVGDVGLYFTGGGTDLASIEINDQLPASYQYVVQQVVLNNLYINGEIAGNQFDFETL